MREDLFKKQLYDLRVKMTLCQMNTNRGIESEYRKIRREYEEAKKAYTKHVYEEKSRSGR